MERIPVESLKTQEKSREELYLDTLKAKRDVLSSHYALNQLRRGKKVEEMSDSDVEDYKAVKKEYDKRRELFLVSISSLNEDDSQKISELTSLTKVEIALSSLEKPAEVSEGIRPEDFDKDSLVKQVVENIIGQNPSRQAGESVAEPQIEPPHRDMTLEEIQGRIDAEKANRQTLGLNGEGVEYWEAQRALLLERHEAEANPDKPAPKGFVKRLRDSYDKGKEAIMGANRISGGSETVESRMSLLGLRKEAIKPVSPEEPGESIQSEEVHPIQPEVQPQPEVMSQQMEKEPKKPSGWGWLKERGKGIWNFGIWEFHQAERFRSKTKEVANDTDALATLIQQERNLSLEEAQAEAQEITNELKKNNLEGIGTAEFYQANSDIISDRKKKENDEEIEYIIKSSGNDLLDKLAEYRGEAGQDVLTQENKLAFQADLRGELNKLRDGAFRKDFVNFAKLMRRNLDENWYRRYVWGSVEALAWIGVGWASMTFLATKEAAIVAAKAVAGGAGGAEAAREFVEKGMHGNVWNTLKEMAQNGPGHFTPTGEQLKEWSQAVLDSIKHYEPEWVNNVVEGLKSSRTMPEGFTLKIPVEIMKQIQNPGL